MKSVITKYRGDKLHVSQRQFIIMLLYKFIYTFYIYLFHVVSYTR